MSDEPKYPPAWGLWFRWRLNPAGGLWGSRLFETEDGATHSVGGMSDTDCSVVELVPRPEVDRLIAAERERCAAIAAEVCRQAMRTDPQDSTDYDHGWWKAAEEIAIKIREVPE